MIKLIQIIATANRSVFKYKCSKHMNMKTLIEHIANYPVCALVFHLVVELTQNFT